MMDIDAIISRLLDASGAKMNALLLEEEIRYLCRTSREIFLSQPMLLEVEAPMNICGCFALFMKLLD